jgi:hypothetical protein
MAVALNNVTRMSQAETNADGGNWDKWATAQNPANEVDFVYQLGTNSQALSNKVSSTTGGVEFTATTAVDYSTTARTVLTLVNVTTYGLINTAVHLGTSYQIGSTDDANDVIDYYLHGSFNDYPPKGGWLIVAIDPNEVAYKDLVTGTPSLTAVDYYSWRAAITASAKAENVVMDALCYMNSDSGGLIWTGTGGSFQDFIDYDEGTIANRYGIVYTEQDALIITGTLTIGSGTATTFTDTGKVLFWTESLTAAGFNALDIDLSNATNSTRWTSTCPMPPTASPSATASCRARDAVSPRTSSIPPRTSTPPTMSLPWIPPRTGRTWTTSSTPRKAVLATSV